MTNDSKEAKIAKTIIQVIKEKNIDTAKNVGNANKVILLPVT